MFLRTARFFASLEPAAPLAPKTAPKGASAKKDKVRKLRSENQSPRKEGG